MKFVVTGASGFLGRHLLAALHARGHEIVALSRDPRRLDDLPHIRAAHLGSFGEHVGPETTVVHLAALRNATGSSQAQFREANVRLPESLARASLGARRFIHVGSALALGSSATPLDETAAVPASTAYFRSRAAGLAAVEAIAALPLVSVLPTIVFGPDHPRARNRLTAQMRRLLARRWRVLAGDAPRNLVFADDVIHAILSVAERPTVNGRFIVGGEDITQDAFDRAVYTAAGRRPTPALHVPSAALLAAGRIADRVRRTPPGDGWTERFSTLLAPWCFRSARAKAELGHEPTPLSEGISRTVRSLDVRS